jgi:metallophosphoesterase superfamily enzyme
MQCSFWRNNRLVQEDHGSARVQHLILSDLHLGKTSRAREATRVLKENRFERFILLGDIFADLNFARLTKEHWKFRGYIRKLSNPKRNIEVVWVEGNHDGAACIATRRQKAHPFRND